MTIAVDIIKSSIGKYRRWEMKLRSGRFDKDWLSKSYEFGGTLQSAPPGKDGRAFMAARKKQIRSGRPTQSQIDLRKARVLEVSEELFMSRGFSGTSVAEIARRSRVSPRLVAAHFGDKEQIFGLTITERMANASQAFVIPAESNDLDQILFDAAKFAWNVAYSPPSISFLRMVVGEGERFLKMTSEIALRSSNYFFGAMELTFTHLIDRGLIETTNAPRMAKYFVDLIIGFSLVQAGMGYTDRVPDDDELRDKIRFFRLAIAAEAKLSGNANAKLSALAK